MWLSVPFALLWAMSTQTAAYLALATLESGYPPDDERPPGRHPADEVAELIDGVLPEDERAGRVKGPCGTHE